LATLRQGKYRIDHRADLAAFYELAQAVELGAVLRHKDKVQRDVLVPCRKQILRLWNIDNRDEPAERPEDGSAPLDDVAAYRVEHEMDPAPSVSFSITRA